MKAPICDICLRSSILCVACLAKLEKGEISEGDVRISRTLFDATERFKSLRGVIIHKVIETPNNILIIPEKGDAAKIIGKGGTIVKELIKILGKNVRIIEETHDKREFIEKVIFPAKVSAMNILYTDEGEALKVMVDRQLSLTESSLREVVKQVYGQDVKVVNE